MDAKPKDEQLRAAIEKHRSEMRHRFLYTGGDPSAEDEELYAALDAAPSFPAAQTGEGNVRVLLSEHEWVARLARHDDVVWFARCPEHGLHGQRVDCFECGAKCEQVPFAPAPVGSPPPARSGEPREVVTLWHPPGSTGSWETSPPFTEDGAKWEPVEFVPRMQPLGRDPNPAPDIEDDAAPAPLLPARDEEEGPTPMVMLDGSFEDWIPDCSNCGSPIPSWSDALLFPTANPGTEDEPEGVTVMHAGGCAFPAPSSQAAQAGETERRPRLYLHPDGMVLSIGWTDTADTLLRLAGPASAYDGFEDSDRSRLAAWAEAVSAVLDPASSSSTDHTGEGS